MVGGSIGALYHGPGCQYVGPIVIERMEASLTDQPFADEEAQVGVSGVHTGTLFWGDLSGT